MKLIVLTSNKTSRSIIRFEEEAKKRKIKVEIFNYRDISFTIKGKDIYFSSKNKKISFKSAIVRSGRPQLYDVREIKIHDLLLKYFYENDIFFTNKNFLKDNYLISNKIVQYLTLSKYTKRLINPTFYFETKEELLYNLEYIQYPIIIKPIDGSKGTGIEKINNEKELIEMFKYLEVNNFVFQKYIPNNGDVRILYIGGKYIGSMMRSGQNNNIVNNFSKGGKVEKYKLKNSIKKELDILVKRLNIDYVGIDIIIDKNNFYILEINRNPGFEGFELCTNINVAGKVIDFMLGFK
ncbi:ATP-grasp domain-containing protein [Candidatus Gracilibacteria bacterium]|nr:ATP-grasp domain-containing protein [Candidatus Gracilibacteria bacterium]